MYGIGELMGDFDVGLGRCHITYLVGVRAYIHAKSILKYRHWIE